MQNKDEVKVELRTRACLIVLDAERRVLLFRHADRCGREYWATPGGGVEPGETLEQAAHREAAEELGAERVEVTPLWSGQADFSVADRRISQSETFFLVDGPLCLTSAAAAAHHRSENVQEKRWWPIADLQHSPQPFYPADLVDRLGHLGSGKLSVAH